MGEHTKIEWTDYTWNPWLGCEKVSAGCKNCYAEQGTPVRIARSRGVEMWGSAGVRKVTSDATWKMPLRWDRQAARSGVRRRVFPSLCDPFEDREELFSPRAAMFDLIERTPNLDWLLLTKRPENVQRMIVEAGASYGDNLWIGTSVEDQEAADWRIPELLKIPAKVRFLSCEPLLGPVEFSDVTHRSDCVFVLGKPAMAGIHWVIVGGESGPNARPMDPDWVRGLRDQCRLARVPFFFKQWGEWHPLGRDSKQMHYIGKKAAGRMLDGLYWNEVPMSKE